MNYSNVYIVLLILIFVFGMICIVYELGRITVKCDQQKTVYKYIPRTFKEDQMQPALVSDIFKVMFTQQSPWISDSKQDEIRKDQNINKYFISQM